MMSHVQVIDAFGGIKPLAELLGIEARRAIHWRTRGIPAKYWPIIEERAGKQAPGITAVKLSKMPVSVSGAASIRRCA